jgi:hypothetical protein
MPNAPPISSRILQCSYKNKGEGGQEEINKQRSSSDDQRNQSGGKMVFCDIPIRAWFLQQGKMEVGE